MSANTTSSAIVPLDGESNGQSTTTSTDATFNHRYGTIPDDMTVVMEAFPQHRYHVHRAILALHSSFFSTVITKLSANSSVVHLPKNPNSTPEALGFLLQMIYNGQQHVELKSSNRYIVAGDVITEDNIAGTVTDVVGQNEGKDVEITATIVCNDYGLEEHDHAGDGLMRGVLEGNDTAYLHHAMKASKPRTPLPQLETSTSIAQVLPLVAYFDSSFLLFHLEEHLITVAYYASTEKRLHYLKLADQYKLLRSFQLIVGFCQIDEIKQLVQQKNNTSGFSNSALEVMVDRLAKQ